MWCENSILYGKTIPALLPMGFWLAWTAEVFLCLLIEWILHLYAGLFPLIVPHFISTKIVRVTVKLMVLLLPLFFLQNKFKPSTRMSFLPLVNFNQIFTSFKVSRVRLYVYSNEIASLWISVIITQSSFLIVIFVYGKYTKKNIIP